MTRFLSYLSIIKTVIIKIITETKIEIGFLNKININSKINAKNNNCLTKDILKFTAAFIE
jgi:hypothetical protein